MLLSMCVLLCTVAAMKCVYIVRLHGLQNARSATLVTPQRRPPPTCVEFAHISICICLVRMCEMVMRSPLPQSPL